MNIKENIGFVSIIFLIFYDLMHDVEMNQIVEGDLIIFICFSLVLNALSLGKSRKGSLRMQGRGY